MAIRLFASKRIAPGLRVGMSVPVTTRSWSSAPVQQAPRQAARPKQPEYPVLPELTALPPLDMDSFDKTTSEGRQALVAAIESRMQIRKANAYKLADYDVKVYNHEHRANKIVTLYLLGFALMGAALGFPPLLLAGMPLLVAGVVMHIRHTVGVRTYRRARYAEVEREFADAVA